MNNIAIFSTIASIFLALIITQFGFGDIRYFLLGIALCAGATFFDPNPASGVPTWYEVKEFIIKVLFKSPATVVCIVGIYLFYGNILHIFQFSIGSYLVYAMILMNENSNKGEEE